METEISGVGGEAVLARADALVRRQAGSPALQQRRFELVPVNGLAPTGLTRQNRRWSVLAWPSCAPGEGGR